jgi:predicted ATPase
MDQSRHFPVKLTGNPGAGKTSEIKRKAALGQGIMDP